MEYFFPFYSKDFEALPFLIVLCWVGTGMLWTLHGGLRLWLKGVFWAPHVVQSLGRVMSDSLQPHGLQHARLPRPSTISQSLPKLMFTESVMTPNHLILCHPLLLPSIYPSIRVFSSELVLCITWSKYWRFSFLLVLPEWISSIDFLWLTGLV